MTREASPGGADLARIREVVRFYKSPHVQELLERFREHVLVAIRDSRQLKQLVHSLKSRLKDPDHLHGKLVRKWREAQESGRRFDIASDNLLARITDLVGVRILHLHTSQARDIDQA